MKAEALLGPAAQVVLDFLREHEQEPDHLHPVYVAAKLARGLDFQVKHGRDPRLFQQLLDRLTAELEQTIGGPLPIEGILGYLKRLMGAYTQGRLSRLDIARAAHHHGEALAWVRKAAPLRTGQVYTYVCGPAFSMSATRSFVLFEGPYRESDPGVWEGSMPAVARWPSPWVTAAQNVVGSTPRQDLVHGHNLVTFLSRVGRTNSAVPEGWAEQGWQRMKDSATVFRLAPALSWRTAMADAPDLGPEPEPPEEAWPSLFARRPRVP